jgi:hypothetical protein
MSNQRTGRAFIYVNGALYESMDGAKLTDPMGVTRDALIIAGGVAGYTETDVVPKISATFADGQGLSLQAIAALVNETITFKTDSGKSYVLRNAFYMSGMELNVSGGKGAVAVVFGGKKCDELIGS